MDWYLVHVVGKEADWMMGVFPPGYSMFTGGEVPI
jgi:hypothetical protein